MGTEPTDQAIQNEQDYILQTYPRPDFVLEHGEGVYLYDTAGRRYLDFVAGIAVNALGYGDAEITRTIAEQSARLMHVSNLYHTVPGGELAKLLIENSPGFDRVFFCNSGAEAIEGSLKFARKFARVHHSHSQGQQGADKTRIIAFDGSFHGRTVGALSLTSRAKYREPFMPLMPNVTFAPFNDRAALDDLMGDDVCAVVVEPVQGEGGLRVADEEFLQHVRALCDQHNALLITDEIQCGMGRTGTLWAHTPYGIQPDIMALAKPLAAGLPVGAILMSQRVADVIKPGDHGTTFGGGPLTTAVAQVVLRRISAPEFLDHINQMSHYLDEALHDFAAAHPDTVQELRGRGLMRGLKINGSAAVVRQRGHQVGLLVATAGEDVVRLLPPLIVQPQHVDEALDKLAQAFHGLHGLHGLQQD
jgi:acetylornithine/N-succinyldiaminopimelate aminotransferase